MTVPQAARTDQIVTGIGIILLSTFAMAFSDAVVKLLSSELTIWQVFAVRSSFAIPCLLVFVYWQRQGVKPNSVYWVLIRSVLIVLTWLAYYAALPVLSLSVAAVAVYTNPIITTLLSSLLIGERVSKRQWAGILIGFIGVIVILKPGTDAFSWAILLPLLGALFYSLAMIITRTKCKSEKPVTLALSLHVLFVVTGSIGVALLSIASLSTNTIAAYPFLLDGWPKMGATDWATMAFLGLLSAAFFLGVAKAYQIAPPHIIATFDYGYLVSAVFWSVVLFTETPDKLTVIGILLITGAGVLVASTSAKQ